MKEHFRNNAYISENNRIIYVATPKVAGTTLKWWFADLEGKKEEIINNIDSYETNQDLKIHDTFYKVAPQVTGLEPDIVINKVNSGEYFSFALVRNPYKRIFSAWQSKILFFEPLQMEKYLDTELSELKIKNFDDLRSSFENFLNYLYKNEADNNFQDVHWIPQYQLLEPEVLNYSLICKIEDTKPLINELRKRLKNKFTHPFREKTNNSLIPYSSDFFTEKSTKLIKEIYEKDFNYFNYTFNLPRVKNKFSEKEFNLALYTINSTRSQHKRFFEVVNKQRIKNTIEQDNKFISSMYYKSHCDDSYNEKQVIRQTGYFSNKNQILNFEFSTLKKTISALRFDITGCPAKVTIYSVEVTNKQGEVLWKNEDAEDVRMVLVKLSPDLFHYFDKTKHEHIYISIGNDPNMILNLPEAVFLRLTEQFSIKIKVKVESIDEYSAKLVNTLLKIKKIRN